MGLEYVQRVSQVRDLARRYWFDVLVAVLAIVAMLEVALGRGSPGAPQTTLWFSVPAIAILMLRRAALGLAAVVGGAATIVYNIPGHSATTQVFVPLEFAISWVAGFALRERAVQAEAAESRATQAERERDTAARHALPGSASKRQVSRRSIHFGPSCGAFQAFMRASSVAGSSSCSSSAS